jgi:hypothetical protein
MSLSAPPLRDKIPAKTDAAGNVWIELPYAWQKWFSSIPSAITLEAGLLKLPQYTTANAPPYVKGGMYFDTTLNKARVGGATAYETITSV